MSNADVHYEFYSLLNHQGRELIAIVVLENGAFCTVFSENFHNF
jgi:hypothetical protein